jgi:hypothetical protein
MAPGQRRRGFWLELIFVSILLFLLMGARTERTQKAVAPQLPKQNSGLHGFLPASLAPLTLQ